MAQDVQKPAPLQREDDLLERNLSLSLKMFIFLVIPTECFHAGIIPSGVPFVITFCGAVNAARLTGVAGLAAGWQSRSSTLLGRTHLFNWHLLYTAFTDLPLLRALVALGNCYRPFNNLHNLVRGRDAGFPAPPAQIPACGITAPGSCLGSDAEALFRVWVHYPCFGYPPFDPLLMPFPGEVTCLLASPA